MPQTRTEYREDDSWFSDAQLAKLTPADAADTFHSPVPTQMVSNGEYMPYPQTEKQQQVEARIKQLADTAAKDLGLSRRHFLATTGGMAAAFLAMNDVFGPLFKVRPIDIYEPAAFAQTGAPTDLFVVDTQLHTVRSSLHIDNLSLRSIAQGVSSGLNPAGFPNELGGVNTPWNPALAGLPKASQGALAMLLSAARTMLPQVAVGS